MLGQLATTAQMLAALVGQQHQSALQSASSHAITGREMSKILPKPEPLRQQRVSSMWPAWFWSLEQYLGVLDPAFTGEIKVVKDNLDKPVSPSNPDSQVRAKQLCAMLSVLIKGRGFLLVKSVKDSNGYEALRQLIGIYAPQTKSRSLGILAALTQVSAFRASKPIVQQVLDLERVFNEYDVLSLQTNLPEDLRTALLVRCLPNRPNNYKDQLNAALPEDASYAQVRECVCRMERQRFKWSAVSYFGVATGDTAHDDGGARPMEIGAAQQYKGGKQGGKGKKGGKGKGKGKQGKGKGKYDSGKGKNQNNAGANNNGQARASRKERTATKVRRVMLNLSLACIVASVVIGSGSSTSMLQILQMALWLRTVCELLRLMMQPVLLPLLCPQLHLQPALAMPSVWQWCSRFLRCSAWMPVMMQSICVCLIFQKVPLMSR